MAFRDDLNAVHTTPGPSNEDCRCYRRGLVEIMKLLDDNYVPKMVFIIMLKVELIQKQVQWFELTIKLEGC